MKPVILPYSTKSQSAKRLQRWLQDNGYRKLKRVTEPRSNRLVINWGNSTVFNPNASYINYPLNIAFASDKLKAFTRLQAGEVNLPQWTTNQEEAFSWCKAHPHPYECAGFARTVLNGHSGRGIVPFFHACDYSMEGEVFPMAPLYVQYKKKKKELRIHVFRGKILDIQEKRKRSGVETNSLIRNHHTGWVYCREDVQAPHDAVEQALKAVDALGLDFGAVDLIYNQHENKSYVLEVNTAPGLEGTTLELYGRTFKESLDANH